VLAQDCSRVCERTLQIFDVLMTPRTYSAVHARVHVLADARRAQPLLQLSEGLQRASVERNKLEN